MHKSYDSVVPILVHSICSERVLMYNISDSLGRVASIYHGTARRECYKMLLISLRHIVT